VKPTTNTKHFVAVVIERPNGDYQLFDYLREPVGIVTVPRWWQLRRKYRAVMNTREVGKFDTAQSALDALVAAYERSLDAEPGKTCPSCHGSAITQHGDGYAECGDCECVFLVNVE